MTGHLFSLFGTSASKQREQIPTIVRAVIAGESGFLANFPGILSKILMKALA